MRHHILAGGAAERVRGSVSRGRYDLLRELTLSGAVASDTRHPPAYVGTQGIIHPHGYGGSARFRFS